MARRRAVALLAGSALAGWCGAALAQRPSARVGVLTPSDEQWNRGAFEHELRGLGRAGGRELDIRVRSARGNLDALQDLARELVAERVNVIVAVNTPSARAAASVTRTIPIVVGASADAAVVGVRNMSRPEGNVTGVTNMAGEIVTKRLEILKQALPSATRIATLMHPDEPIARTQMHDLARVARPLEVTLRHFPARDEAGLHAAVAAAVDWQADALFRLAGQGIALERVASVLAVERRMPYMALTASGVEQGALLSYFADHAVLWRRVAQYVDRLLGGTPVGELPFERPTKFELAVNLRTARRLGIELPRLVLMRADRVVD